MDAILFESQALSRGPTENQARLRCAGYGKRELLITWVASLIKYILWFSWEDFSAIERIHTENSFVFHWHIWPFLRAVGNKDNQRHRFQVGLGIRMYHDYLEAGSIISFKRSTEIWTTV